MHEIILPDEPKPALEWINNRIVPKVSPDRSHALAQGRFWAALDVWAASDSKGTAGTEWRFLVQPAGEIARTLVPDVAYLSYERMPRAKQEETRLPRITPDAIVEILSPDERRKDVEEKTRAYLAGGASVVFLVDTGERTVQVIDSTGRITLREADTIEHRSLPGLRFPVLDLFRSP